MKNLAKLVLFFIVVFALILFLAGVIGLFHTWAETAVLFPVPADITEDLTAMARIALPAALYIAILLGLNFTAHRKISYPLAFAVMLVLSVGLSTAASLGLSRLENMHNPLLTLKSPHNLGRPGLILTVLPGEGRVPLDAGTYAQSILMESTGEGARIVSMPRQPLYYQESLSYQAEPIRLPFKHEIHPILQGISADFAKNAQFFRAWFNAGVLPFCIYAGALSALLISIGCLVNISFWSLANLFFGALAFRGILALEAFLNSAGIHNLLSSFVGGLIPESLINPLIFGLLGLLILLYSGLVYLARGRRQG